MPEDAHTTLQGLLSKLEELQNSPEDAIYIMNSEIMQNLISINTFLSSSDEISSTEADRVLKVCLQYKLDIKCAPYILSIISSLINIDKTKPFVPAVDFLQTALGVLEFLKSKCIDDKTRNLRILSFQVLVSHPLTTLVKLVNSHCPLLIETLGLFLDSGYTDAKTEPFVLLQLLHLLPPAEKSMFVKEGIPIWLSKLFPSLMRILLSLEDKEKIEMCLSYTDILTEQLVLHDYFEDHQWQYFLESVADAKKFPVCIKNLLESGKDTWHRIWILIVRLLKNNITKNFGSFGTPINSMLPVVESAFKKDSMQRVRAFACWEELILNFSNETNPNCIGKRIKLVIIPLRLNNAKTEDTALAKFYTWWLLIRKFKPQLKKYTSEILVPFLHFVFGKRQTTKPTFWAGQLSNDMKKKCLEAFVEIVGHSDCDSSCTSTIKPLNGKVITTVMLADYWKDWVYSLKTAVNMVARIYNPEAKKNIRCIWKSFILQMTELLDNSMRRDWFDELINLLLVFVQESATYSDLSEIIIEDLTLPLFKDNRIYTLLSSRNQEHRPMHRIVIIITGTFFDSYYKRFSPQDLSTMLEPLVSTLVIESVATPAYLIWLLDELPFTDSALKLWTVLVRKVTESDLCLQVFNSLLRWPFNILNAVSDVKDAALAWYTLYNVVHVKLDKTGFDNAISKLLTKPVEDSKAANYFILFALIGVLKHKPNEDKMAKLEALTFEMTDSENFEPLIPSLVDTLALMIDNSSTKEYEHLAQITMNCVNNVLKLINNNTKIEDVPSISSEIASSEVRVNFPMINKSVLNNIITTSMKKYLSKCTDKSIKKEIRNVISSLEKTDEKPKIESPKKTAAVKEFISPKVKDVKKNKKKEPSIVNTVFENGEEYVVVKSNWKFNPKNLTENQKEKLQRKRDIPALYQDLSQSQDEFKLTAWKPDSQDTSLSSSKSASNSDATEILKNMSSTDVVPKIMENILDNANNTQKTNINTSPGPVLLKVDKVVTPKGTKSPRMALKDRVFRNVRNLIEKSSPSPMIEVKDKQDLIILDDVPKSPTIKPVLEITHTKDELSQIANVVKSTAPKSATDDNVIEKQENQNSKPKSADENNDNKLSVTSKLDDQNITSICTPVTKRKKDKNITKPSFLSTERPARMKRKPKKFDDSLLLAFKRSRHSNNESQSDSQDSPYVLPEITVAQVHTKDNNDIPNVDQADKTVTAEDVEATKKVHEDETRTASTDDVILLDNEKLMDCVKETGDTTPHTFENTVVITPTTPISDKTEKSPEKPTNIVKVPSDKDKASKGIGNGAAQIITKEANEDLEIAKTPLNKLKEVNQQKSSVKRNRARNDSDDKQVQIIKTPLTRKAKVLVENRITPERAPSLVITLCNIIKSPNQEKSKKSVVENETIVDDLKSDALSTPINKTNIAKDANQQKSTKTVEQNINQNDEKSEPTDEIKEINLPKSAIKRKDAQTEDNKNENIDPVTPKNKGKDAAPQSSVKKTTKKSLIDKKLMIDMVEGHPFLKAQSEKRLTRKKILEVENSSRRKTLVEKLNKAKLEATPKTTKKTKEKKTSTNKVIVEDSQDRSNSAKDAVMDEPPCSEDIIESSQDSTITTISVKSTKRTPQRQLFVTLEKIDIQVTETQDLIQDCEMIDVPNEEVLEKTDIELPQNKTAEVDKDTTNLTENMDTEPMDENNVSDEVIVLDETQSFPITINSEPVIGPETQEIAEADTQPNDPKDFVEFELYVNMYQPPFKKAPEKHIEEETNITQTLSEVNTANDDTNKVLSPFKDENERKQDFLNNTLEISPIKIQSPDREKESPSPETSSDFVVIKLSSPVHSNGEPFEQHGSPEFFTEDKISPDKRDASPPRGEVTVTNSSPSSSLSLKKNRPQVRPGGRAAQMLGLCVNSDLKVPKASERIEPEESKKCSMPARRNLRILYNSVGDNDPPENAEEAEHFLKLKRTLPTVTSSPSGPILKRKLIDIADETTASPASKRKRVSFHDPPVSTTISVYKYIEPLSMVRSPQSSAKKRQERQTRFGIKSPKRLDNTFTSLLGVLDSALSKTVESFTEPTPTDDTQNVSLDITPIVEVVKTSELNDTDPFYPDLVECKDPIDVIATELSSPTTRELFIKELEGKVETVGDLAKMTELEIHRLCIKAPKIKVARKVLSDFATKRVATELVETVIEEAFSKPMTESLLNKTADIEMQTDVVEVSSAEIQTDIQAIALASTQTENVSTAHTSMQTDESDKTTEEMVSICLAREDFIRKLTENLDDESIKTIAVKLPTKSLFDLVVVKSDSSTLLNSLLKCQSKGLPSDKRSSAELSLVRDLLCERYESRDLILLCSQMLQKIHDKSDKPT